MKKITGQELIELGFKEGKSIGASSKDAVVVTVVVGIIISGTVVVTTGSETAEDGTSICGAGGGETAFCLLCHT